mmetsp:Transcript_97162/g.182719  ORF Transcript_97162/g.182719 Transcript_97162/m.182719 type:complete len:80 (+) Transcript_97162:18-257(+)
MPPSHRCVSGPPPLPTAAAAAAVHGPRRSRLKSLSRLTLDSTSKTSASKVNTQVAWDRKLQEHAQDIFRKRASEKDVYR